MKFTLSTILLCCMLILEYYQIKTSLQLEHYDNTKLHDDLITEVNDERKNQANPNLKTHVKKDDPEFSACLMVKDENHNLPEWIAYHYTMANLKYLIICLDPNSKTSPKPIATKWKDKMKIEVWSNRTYFDWEDKRNKKIFQRKYDRGNRTKDLVLHRARQRDCYKNCMKNLKKKGMTWTMLIDVDEYLSFNPVSDHDSNLLYKKINPNDPNSAYKFHVDPNMNRSDVLTGKNYKIAKGKSNKSFKKKQEELRNNASLTEEQKLTILNKKILKSDKKLSKYNSERLSEDEMQLMNMRITVPNNRNNAISLPTYLKNQIQGIENPFQNASCIVLPRLQFGSTKETNSTVLSMHMPKSMQESTIVHNLTTLRFFHHKRKGSGLNNAGKCIVDVSRIKSFQVMNPHRINPECGAKFDAYAEHYTSFFRVNHYSGTKELYYAQGGVRRDSKNFDMKSNSTHSVTYEMQGWLEKFVDEVGTENAMALLDGAGRITNQ